MNRRNFYPLLLIVLASATVSGSMLERDHGWGDDFAAYIMQAQALSGGHLDEYIQMSQFTVEELNSSAVGPVTVPWGFPLMLAPVAALFGTKILAFKLVLTISYVLFLIVFFLLAGRRFSPAESLLLTAVFAFNPSLLRAQNEILSDIPFLLFSSLGLLLIELYASEQIDSRQGVLLAVLLGIVLFLAACTRPNGFLLIVPMATAQLVRSCSRPRASITKPLGRLLPFIPYLTAAFSYLTLALLLPTTGNVFQTPILETDGASFVPNPTLFNAWPTILGNLYYYFWLPGEILRNTVFAVDGGVPAYLVLLAFAIVGAARDFVKNAPMILYALFTLGLFVISGGIQGIRYVYPILPALVLFAFAGMKLGADWLRARLRAAATVLVYAVWLLLVVSSVVTTTGWASLNMSRNRMPPGRWWGGFSAGSTLMFDFIGHQTPEDSVIVFFKPRLMRLRTHRNSFMTVTCDGLPRGDYVVSIKDNGTYNQIAPELIESCNAHVTLTPVYDRDDWIIYKIAPQP